MRVKRKLSSGPYETNCVSRVTWDNRGLLNRQKDPVSPVPVLTVVHTNKNTPAVKYLNTHRNYS